MPVSITSFFNRERGEDLAVYARQSKDPPMSYAVEPPMLQSNSSDRVTTRRTNRRSVSKRYTGRMSSGGEFCNDQEEEDDDDDENDDGSVDFQVSSRKRSSVATNESRSSKKDQKDPPKHHLRRDSSKPVHKRHGAGRVRVGSIDLSPQTSGRPPKKKARGNSTSRSNNTSEAVNDMEMERFVDPLVSDHNCVSLQELLHITNNLSFYKPDTYPIYYAAQLLGLTHVLQSARNEMGDRSNDTSTSGGISGAEILSRLQQLPKRHTHGAESRSQDIAFDIPPRGIVPDHVKFWGGSCYQNYDTIWLRQQQKNCSRSSSTRAPVSSMNSPLLDPLYVQLWSTPKAESVRVPVTPVQHARLFHSISGTSKKPTVTADCATLDDISLDAATAEGVDGETKRTIPNERPASTPAWQTIILDKVWRAHDEVLASLVTAQAGHKPPEQIKLFTFMSLDEARAKYPLDVEDFLSAGKQQQPNRIATGNGITAGFVAVMRHDLTSPGLVLGTKETEALPSPVAMELRCRILGAVLYQFEWYRGIQQPAEASELIMNMHEIAVVVSHQQNMTTKLDADHQAGLDCDKVDALDATEIDQIAVLWIRVMLTTLALEQARFFNVWYAIVPSCSTSDRGYLEKYFGMVGTTADPSTLICDMHQGSSRFSFLLFHESLSKSLPPVSTSDATFRVGTCKGNNDIICPKRRWLVRLPTVNDVASALSPPTVYGSKLCEGPVPTQYFSNPEAFNRDSIVALRFVISNDENHRITIHKLNAADGSAGPEEMFPSFHRDPPSLDILRGFLLECRQGVKCIDVDEAEAEDELVSNLLTKQNELADLENHLAPRIQVLFAHVVAERMQYESAEAIAKREDELRVLCDSQSMMNRRKELDVAWQQQLELDMDAVCEICADGEVTPDNQILFCEACNVAVHQMCYGIEQVPDGDYYCMPCRRLHQALADELPIAPNVLSIYCELCPLRKGAFKRTDVKRITAGTNTCDKWVHVVCAKWLGLNYVNDGLQESIEDVTDLTTDFRRHRITCELCLGERGGMNQCAYHSCKKYFHVTCARAVGTMKVTHGENCKGPVIENAWKLFCPEHSNATDVFVPKNLISIESLILAAGELPSEPKPPPIPRPFNTLTGLQRKELLADSNYECALMEELLTKRYFGVRCDVCDIVEDDSKALTRCVTCNTTFCSFCKVDSDDSRNMYKCDSCIFMERKRKAGEEFEVPHCSCCYQKGGLLRESYATPVTMKTWRKRPEQLKASVFGKPIWTHSICACWLPELDLPKDTGIVDLSSVFLGDGKGLMINWKHMCFLCGGKGGLKVDCDRPDCFYETSSGKTQKISMHVTCARQAGFEVVADQERVNKFGGPLCYVRCYRHGGNEFNLRAKLEDLLEIEKRRAGKDLSKAEYPMTFSDAARLLNSSISILKVLGWAWRWAYLWVDYNSSWEPLLDEGQDEGKMTDDELKIVHTTRESRCDDARKCRLAAFGAALRNRNYDAIDGYNSIALERALRAILKTQSLVGPLDKAEVDFFVEWLSRAYRSKSRLLCFGDNKNEISNESELCMFKDKSPKYELGDRPIPGTQELSKGHTYEVVDEIDDFMDGDLFGNEVSMPGCSTVASTGNRNRTASVSQSTDDVLPSTPHNRRATSSSPKNRAISAQSTYKSDKVFTWRGRPRKAKRDKESVGKGLEGEQAGIAEASIGRIDVTLPSIPDSREGRIGDASQQLETPRSMDAAIVACIGADTSIGDMASPSIKHFECLGSEDS